MQEKRKVTTLWIGAVIIVFLVIMAGIIMAKRDPLKRTEDFTTKIFGSNTYVFSPEDDPVEVNRILDEIWQKQETNQFGEERYAIYFLPGEYDSSIDVKVGFYTQVAGLGEKPSDTKIPSLNCDARWLGDDDSNHNACCNFWRGVENLEVESNTMWAVSQATFMRRTSINGALYLHDNYGWCSGGFLADSKVSLMIDSGSQQQWLSRNNEFKTWMGDNWNLVFVGDEEGCDPTATWPAKSYTSVKKTPEIREKPYLIYDDKAGYQVVVPALRKDASGISWGGDTSEEKKIPVKEFYVANPLRDTSATLNEALSYGKHIIFTPGIYQLEEPLNVDRKDTILLGMGLATLEPLNGNACIVTSNEEGIILAGLLFDAGEKESENLLVIGETGEYESTAENPISLSDLFFRVGGTNRAYAGKVKQCLAIHADHVIGDNFWVWRADHGDMVAWDENTGDTGITVNGDDVTIYALMVEHFEQYQTIWNGENGKVFMYQSELPYDVPEQAVWMSENNTVNGYASFYVEEAVKQFEAWGLGIYSYHRDAVVDEYSAMVVPDTPDVKIHNICTVMLTGNPGISHVINDSGDAAIHPSDRSIILEYADGVQK